MDMEYWITDTGEEICCESSFSLDHEEAVAQFLFSRLTDELCECEGLGTSIGLVIRRVIENQGVDPIGVWSSLIDFFDDLERRGVVNDHQSEYFDDLIMDLVGESDLREAYNDLLVHCGTRQNDLRKTGLELLGWVRVVGKCLETWEINEKQCSLMLDFAMKHNDHAPWCVEVWSPRHVYIKDISTADLGSPHKLRRLAQVSTFYGGMA